jgi:hypothetical protein
MATSGSYDWTLSRDQIITAALRKLGVVRHGVTPSADQITYGAEQLNAMVKDWHNDGVHLWALDWVANPLATASSEVTGTDSLIYTCILGHTSANDNKPITGTNWSTFWVLRGETGGAWGSDTAYTSIGDGYFAADTLSVEKAFIRYNETDYPLIITGYHDYLDIPDKSETGMPRRIMIDKSLPNHRAIFWPIPDRTDYVFHYLRTRKLEDYDASGNTSDFPERWLLACVYGLASLLAPEYRISTQVQAAIDQRAIFYFQRAKLGSNEALSDNFTVPCFRP